MPEIIEPKRQIVISKFGGNFSKDINPYEMYNIDVFDPLLRDYIASLPYWEKEPKREGLYTLFLEVSSLYDAAHVLDQVEDLTPEDVPAEFREKWELQKAFVKKFSDDLLGGIKSMFTKKDGEDGEES